MWFAFTKQHCHLATKVVSAKPSKSETRRTVDILFVHCPAGGETSRITSLAIFDRGESLYRTEHPLESPQPVNGHSAILANRSWEPLVDRLNKLQIEWDPSTRAIFYPRAEVEALITAEETLTNDEIDEYALRVCRDTLPDGTHVSYKRTFAILLLFRRGYDIVLFVDVRIHDAKLPLEKVTVQGNVRMRHESDVGTDLPCLRHWDTTAHRDFGEKQWSMLAPFLAKGNRRRAWFYQLSERDILPWTSKEVSVREGGYGSISKVKIYSGHHNFDGGNGFFAVKEFKPKATPTSGTDLSESFEREIEILMRFSGDVHPHLISLQAAYRQGDTYCVILPWADCDLKSLWKRSSLGDPLHKPNLVWMLGQCVGIASGLNRIHRYTSTETATDEEADASPRNNKIYGRHGDIKPENILLFRDHQNSQDLECDMEKRTVSRSFDIWSLGCVLLEFVAWYLGGWDLVSEFVTCRKTTNPLYAGWLVDDFFEIIRHEQTSLGTVYVRVKCEVHDFVHNNLHAHPKCPKPVQDLLDFVMERMLVVESRGIRKRAQCGEVDATLQAIYHAVEDSNLQTLTAQPRSKVNNLPEAVEMSPNTMARRIALHRYAELPTHTGDTRTIFP
ncbi:kinase-like domain-containing protein [Chaetomium strumarium]|uniref:Kinase-like domain-containing protein n=1 Tax=Chaetomium strumarium TaxID=1170767 RepID=A0AAJ0GQB8_9PEZI|nr:kinase-like domain-containing protein [Chaetomium strumarium]